ncbi:DNA sulfur modification protein DndB [Paenibacillus roseipurpureus]|uniref:DNA sulfur modification protein DndB n=1 Tax=Paenibacillus roseopurpureus TaxID=2918901 RepID=A0AA96LPV4_9BACL|nr:DNA sulfur modification protein DndB [Paenibacillus sp. MBLB1832]WNR45106.1 DNA sulfur modification protein DndB [Paenibacillus sp. MBLB1832]
MQIQQIQANMPNLGTVTASLMVPAILYLHGKRLWYAASIPMKTLGKFVTTSAVKKKNAVIIKADIKNRFLDKGHKEEIKGYIKEEDEYIIPPVTLVSYDELTFKPFTFGQEGEMTQEQLREQLESVGSIAGLLVIPIDYEFECLDGNHRTVAIRELGAEFPEAITGGNILLNIVHETRKRKIRQDFVDVNKTAKSTSPSINTLFNTRDPLAGAVTDVMEGSDYLEAVTELLATSVSKNSKDIYTLNNIKNVIIEIAGRDSQSGASGEKAVSKMLKSDPELKGQLYINANLFFQELKRNKFISGCLSNPEKTPEIRNESVLTSGIGIVIASRIAGIIFGTFVDEEQIKRELERLFNFDWSRSNPIFLGKVVSDDQRLLVSRESINTAAEAIKNHLKY